MACKPEFEQIYKYSEREIIFLPWFAKLYCTYTMLCEKKAQAECSNPPKFGTFRILNFHMYLIQYYQDYHAMCVN